jgi:hypothetical protein
MPGRADTWQNVEEKYVEPPSRSTAVIDEQSYPSTSYGGRVSGLKRVKIDPNDLFVEVSSSSDEELIPIPPVSGPGMGFQLASSLSISSAWPQSTGDTMPSVVSSVNPAENGGRGVLASGGCAKPLPKITNFFERHSERSSQPHSVTKEVSREPLVTKLSEDGGYSEYSDHCRQYRVEQVVPYKNSLTALDEEALPEISNRKKLIADVVVKVLSRYYKKKKVATKELFKLFAKRVSLHLLDHRAASVQKDVEKLLKRYFDKYGRFSSESDMKRLETMLTSCV